MQRRKHLLISKTEYTDTLSAQIFSPFLIVFMLAIVAGAIEFYAKATIRTVEVKDKGGQCLADDGISNRLLHGLSVLAKV